MVINQLLNAFIITVFYILYNHYSCNGFHGNKCWKPVSLLMWIYTPCFECGNRSALSCFQQLIVVLMELCLSLGDQDIAFRFSVNQSTISRYFSKWINAMYVQMKALIKWAERDQFMQTMPMDFTKNLRQCVTIIDCV